MALSVPAVYAVFVFVGTEQYGTVPVLFCLFLTQRYATWKYILGQKWMVGIFTNR